MIDLKIRLILLLFLPSFIVRSQIMWQIKKDTVVKWYYHDGDEFDSDHPDTNKWIPSYSYSQMNYQFDFLMTSKRLVLGNGICRFMCYRDSGLYQVPGWQLSPGFEKENKVKLIDGNKVKYLYTLGTIWSRKEYGKGYFEIRFKSTDACGMWPGFWMYGNNQKDEIDFFELKGERNKDIHLDVHCPYGCDSHYTGGSLFPKLFGGWIKTSQYLKDGYNILGGEWQDGYVKWYLNGQAIGYFKGDFSSQKMSLIAGTGIAKNGYAFSPGVNASTVFPNSLDVDYIRVWYKSKTDTIGIKGVKNDKFSYFKNNTNTSSLRKKIRFMYNKKESKLDILTVSLLPNGNKKFILTSLGKSINYTIIFAELNGKELIRENVQTPFREFELSNLTAEKQVKFRIQEGNRQIEELITIEK